MKHECTKLNDERKQEKKEKTVWGMGELEEQSNWDKQQIYLVKHSKIYTQRARTGSVREDFDCEYICEEDNQPNKCRQH